MKNVNLKILFSLILVNIAMLAMTQQLISEKFQYHSPRPGAQYATPFHSISLRHGDALDPSTISQTTVTVEGSESGWHTGDIYLTGHDKTLVFKPHTPFEYNEKVFVTVNEGIRTIDGVMLSGEEYSFSTMKEDNTYLKERFQHFLFDEYQLMEKECNYSSNHFVSGDMKGNYEFPEDFPLYDVSIFKNPSPGYTYITPVDLFEIDPVNHYISILDNYGTPVYYKTFEPHVLDLNVQETGNMSNFVSGESGGVGIMYGFSVIYDDFMAIIDTFQMGNGYEAEIHDFRLFNDGNYLMFTYDPQIIDMSEIVDGGDPEATVMGCVVQELDADNNVLFEWSSWDDIAITDATPDIDLTAIFIDYCHANAIEKDNDGNLLVSFRNTDEIVKLDRNSGEIIWRLNAINEDLNDFNFLNDDVRFSHQHDIRRQDNGNITMFDNGNLHTPPHSRVIEWEVDEVAMTAELIWNYPVEPDPSIFAFATGGAHRQPNGYTMAGWGVAFAPKPIAIEFSPDFERSWELWGPDSITTYRAHKFEYDPQNFSFSKDTIDYGEYTGYTPEPYILQIFNATNDELVFTGYHNHLDEYYISTGFPITVPAGGSNQLTVNFFPGDDGQYLDVLTLYCDDGGDAAIGKQVVLMGYTKDNTAPAVTFNPADGAEEVDLLPDVMITFDEQLFNTSGEEITDEMIASYIEFKEGDAAGAAIDFVASIGWYDQNQTIIKVKPTEVLDENTEYYVAFQGGSVQDWSGNVISDTQAIVFTTGEEIGIDEYMVNNVALYPNPASEFIVMEFLEEIPDAIHFYNSQGRMIESLDQNFTNNCSFSINDLPAGMYIAEFVFGQLKTHIQFVKK